MYIHSYTRVFQKDGTINILTRSTGNSRVPVAVHISFTKFSRAVSCIPSSGNVKELYPNFFGFSMWCCCARLCYRLVSFPKPHKPQRSLPSASLLMMTDQIYEVLVFGRSSKGISAHSWYRVRAQPEGTLSPAWLFYTHVLCNSPELVTMSKSICRESLEEFLFIGEAYRNPILVPTP
jgi:hypothetical protein